MPPLSAVVTTFNSADVLEPTLAALGWCDEIVVVDSGSTDGTQEICRRYGCRVIHHDFAGYGRQKHFAVGCAKHDWVFVVDSDEVVTGELREEIRGLLSGDEASAGDVAGNNSSGKRPAEVGFEMPISLVFLGRLLRFGGEYGKLHLRLFDRRAGNYNFDEVHEHVDVRGRVGTLRGRMLHYSYRNLAQYFDKFNRYTSSAAQELFQRGRKTSAAYIVLRLPFTFLHLYLVRGLVLDGYPGFVWALLSALSPTVKHMKLHELHLQARAKTAGLRIDPGATGADRLSGAASDETPSRRASRWSHTSAGSRR